MLVLETVDWSRYASTTIYERLAREGVDRHDGGIAQESAKVDLVANLFADGRDDAHGCSLLVDHTYGCLVGNDAGNGGRRCVAGDSYHVETYRADTRHSLELLYGKGTCLYSVYHTLVLAHGDKGTAKTTYIRRCHDAALLYLVVE